MGCYIWYSEEGTGRGRSPPRPNVTAHPSTASITNFVLFDVALLLPLESKALMHKVMFVGLARKRKVAIQKFAAK